MKRTRMKIIDKRIGFAVLVCLGLASLETRAWAVLFGSDTAAGIVYRIDDAGNAVPWATGLNNPNALAAAPDGSLYVRTTATSDLASNFEVQKITATGVRSTVLSGLTNPYVGSLSVWQFPDGLAADSQGNLFVANAAANLPNNPPVTPPGSLPYGVWKVTPGGTVTSFTPQAGMGTSQFFTPMALAVDTQDNVWVSSGDGFGKISNSGNRLLSTSGGFRVTTLAPDSHGNIYVGNPPFEGISKYDSGGNSIAGISIAGHMTIDLQDNLYFATADGIVRVDQFGQQTPYSSAILNNLTFVVPEPSAVILFALGLLAFAAFSLRRRASARG